MTFPDCVSEFQQAWLPNITRAGLHRLAQLLDEQSPLLVQGAFTRAIPQGCVASHIAWNHPATHQYNEEAGVLWLTRIAQLNPATSKVILAWDDAGLHDRQLCDTLLSLCRAEMDRRDASS